MHARGGKADERIAGPAPTPVDDAVERHRPEGRADEIEAKRRRVAPDHLGQLADLATRDLDPGQLGAGLQPHGQIAQQGGVGLLHGDVVEQRDRLRTDADEVVDVHRHAVDADRVEPARPLGDDHLRADAVGGQGDPQSGSDFEHARVVAGQGHGPRGPTGIDPAQDLDDRLDALVGLCGVHTCGCVGIRHDTIVLHRGDGRRPVLQARARAPQLGQNEHAEHGSVGRVGKQRAVALDLTDQPGRATASRRTMRPPRRGTQPRRPEVGPAAAGAPP